MNRLISAADFQRYCAGVRADRPCEACGGGTFDVYDEALTSRRIAVAAFKAPAYDFPEALPLEIFIASCAGCGAFRQFYRTKILQWLDANLPSA